MNTESYMPYGFCDVRVEQEHDAIAKDASIKSKQALPAKRLEWIILGTIYNSG
jgi:hypothetical protein